MCMELDIHIGNILLKPSKRFNDLSPVQFYAAMSVLHDLTTRPFHQVSLPMALNQRG